MTIVQVVLKGTPQTVRSAVFVLFEDGGGIPVDSMSFEPPLEEEEALAKVAERILVEYAPEARNAVLVAKDETSTTYNFS